MQFLLTLLLILPVLVAGFLGFAPERRAREVALGGSAFIFLLSLLLLGYNSAGADLFWLTQSQPWMMNLASYRVGVDGPAALLVLLTTLMQVLVVVYSEGHITERVREYYVWLMLLEAALIGSFISLDVVLFYIFFEAALVPAYFLIGIWGGPRRVQAATKFFVYTVVGSLLMLASIIGLYLYTRGSGEGLNVVTLRSALESVPSTPALLMFIGFAVAFAVKTGLFPFHTWLPDAYAEAPAPVTVLLSAVMAKLGTYGFYRFCLYLFPEQAAKVAPFLVALGVISIVYGALVAAVQRDAKRVIAYSSVSHLGFVVVGLFSLNSIATSGAILQMINHGITSGALFFIMGIIASRRGTTRIRSLGGLWEQMPLFGRIFLIVTLSSVALPLTNSFVGEFLILLGTFQTHPGLAAIATTGVIFSAVYMLWMFQRVMYGPVEKPEVRRMHDIAGTELGVLVPLVALIFLLGVFPTFALRKLDNSVAASLRGIPGAQVAPSPLATAGEATASPGSRFAPAPGTEH